MTVRAPTRILYIEDSPADTEFLRVGFGTKWPDVDLAVVDTGARAIDALAHPAKGQALPDLIMLDLKMPGMDGHEVLSFVKSDARLRKIPVLVLTSPRLEEDITRAYNEGANCYLAKPDDALGYIALCEEVHRFWIELALLPAETAA